MNQNRMNQLRLHTMVSDGMVLQRDASVKIWGWTEVGEKITVRFRGCSYQAVADSSGKWVVTLMKQEAGGPYEMEIEGREKIILRDILIGDVWICSGQSNMQLPMQRVKDEYADIVANTVNPYIRQFDVPERYDFNTPLENMESGQWISLNHETILDFTAAGFFFAKQLYETYSVPVGLIKTAIGGAHVEAWMSREALIGFPELLEKADRFRDGESVNRLMLEEESREKRWYAQLDATDEGLQKGKPQWFEQDYDDSGWKTMQIPSYLVDQGLGSQNGVYWFRRDILLPASLAGLPARIFMGRIVDADYVYINGKLVGTTDYQYPPRKYEVPAGLLKEGKNTIAVRLISNRGKAGFITEKPYQLIFSGQTVDLTGTWKWRSGAAAEMLPDKTFLHQIPVGLFNGMLSPISEYTVKGVIWYQGESNTPAPENYETLFARMIRVWREKLRQERLPFLYVQLPNYLERENMQAVGKWPLLREAQLHTLRVPDTAMAVAIDIGEWNDLHPLNKQAVGKRLALAARKTAYGERNAVSMGPIYRHMEIMGKEAVLSFTETGTGLISSDGRDLRNFEAAGEDGIFYSADAVIEENRVVVRCEKVRVPCAVRYAWCDSPESINFYNREGLPASPFRTEAV